MRELVNTIKRIGVKAGVIEIHHGITGIEPVIILDFYDEDTGVDCGLDTISLAEYSPIKESYVIWEFNLSSLKGHEVESVKKLILKRSKELEPKVITRANELAKEIHELTGIQVKVNPRIQGRPEVYTEFELNMWHAGEVLQGIDDDY
ncbi:hypothetical protein [Fredinandcohnia sp. 179-A 10B2 NHS]|uniref:hypothetical protein n=1 Tax=Fredinandcohnia sp. 179-A 10B2 NHS TaxID=3235176 RepID=UPI0039A0A989